MKSPRDSGGVYRLKPNLTVPETPSPPAQSRPFRPSSGRVWFFYSIIVLLAIVLTVRMIWNYTQGSPVAEASGDLRRLFPRGTITDRRGNPLAMDSFITIVSVSPKRMNPAAYRTVASALAPLMPNLNEDAILRKIQDHAQDEYLELGYTSLEQFDAVRELFGLPGVNIPDILPHRIYPEGSLAAQSIGFTDRDRYGRSGIERRYDDALRYPKSTFDPPPSLSHIPPELDEIIQQSEFLPSPFHKDIILTLDRVLQYMAEENLRHAISEFQATAGNVIIMDPKTGEILALANWPNFDPNHYADFSNHQELYQNTAIEAIYEPGSVFKLITYAAALEKGVITPETEYEDEALFVYYEQKIQNWDRRGRGVVTANEALAQSLNVVSAKIAIDLGARDFYKAVSLFGFGQPTGVELPNDLAGLVTSSRKNGWVPGSLATNSFGQGISVTPLQMANAVATIANGGVRYRPHIVLGKIEGSKVTYVEPQPKERVISEETAHTLTEMMVNVTLHTPAAIIRGYRIAGKSGTAQIPKPGSRGYEENATNTTFVGFFPADDPQFVVLAKLDRPQTSEWASQTAAHLFRAVAHDLIVHFNIPEDDPESGAMTPFEMQ